MNISTHNSLSAWGGLKLRVLLILGALFVFGVILWIVLLPRIVASTIQSRTGFAVKVDGLSVNPFTANVAVTGLVLKNPAGWPAEGFVDLREFRADAHLFSLFGNRFVVDEIVVDMAQLTLVKNQQGVLNAVAFKEGFTGRPAASEPKQSSASQGFLIKHLVLKFDKLVYADHTGRRPVIKEYNLGLNRDMRDVDSVQKIISPFSGAALGLVTETMGGLFKNNAALLKDAGNTLQDATKKTGEKLKGLLDSLDKKRP
jgi:hypothetical protein